MRDEWMFVQNAVQVMNEWKNELQWNPSTNHRPFVLSRPRALRAGEWGTSAEKVRGSLLTSAVTDGVRGGQVGSGSAVKNCPFDGRKELVASNIKTTGCKKIQFPSNRKECPSS